jgi:hypothetical protein
VPRGAGIDTAYDYHDQLNISAVLLAMGRGEVESFKRRLVYFAWRITNEIILTGV